MNNKLKLIVNVLPVVLVPLFYGRKKIKEHPDIAKLNEVSQKAYTSVKDKSVDTAESLKDTADTIKDKSVSAYESGKHTYDTVSDKISETRQNRQQKKEVKQRLKKEKESRKKFKEESNKTDEVDSLSITKIPKMMKSHHFSLTNEEKTRGMLVSKEVMGRQQPLLERPNFREANTHHPVIYDYDQEKRFSEGQASEKEHLALADPGVDDTLGLEHNTQQMKENNMSQTNNVQEEYFKRVRDHEDNIEAFNNSHLFLKHRQSLAPNLKTEDTEPAFEQSELFQKHRKQAEEHIEKIGRKTSAENHMKRSKKQQKLDEKLKKNV
jgi:hypothetical protein